MFVSEKLLSARCITLVQQGKAEVLIRSRAGAFLALGEATGQKQAGERGTPGAKETSGMTTGLSIQFSVFSVQYSIDTKVAYWNLLVFGK